MNNLNINSEIKEQTIKNCYDILKENYKVDIDTKKILIIYDNLSELSKILTFGYT